MQEKLEIILKITHTFFFHFLGDMIIHTTAEIVIGNCIGFKFQRCFDESTGFDELEITDKPECETT